MTLLLLLWRRSRSIDRTIACSDERKDGINIIIIFDSYNIKERMDGRKEDRRGVAKEEMIRDCS